MTFTALVGRDAELLRLADLLDRDTNDSGGLVTVVGEPGIGKTSLLRELASMAAERDAAVLWGSATEFEQQVAFGVFRDALDEALTDVDETGLATLSERQVGVLRSLFLTLPGTGPIEPVQGDRFHVHRAMRALLDLLARNRRLVLILDDLHWADDGSIELCQHLARHPPRAGLLVAMAYRPRQAPPGLTAVMPAAARHGRVERFELGPLGLADAQRLLAGGLDNETLLRWYSYSEGNPLYLEALARATTGAAEPTTGDTGLQPAQAVQVALARELAGLRPVPLAIAQAAAVVGDAFEPDVAATVAELHLPAALSAIDDLVRRDLVRPARAAGRLQFRHPLVRTVAYESAGPGWRLAAHARAARALRQRGASAIDQAHHVERYATMGDQDSIATLIQAGDAALHTAPAVAAHWFRAALRLLPERDGVGETRLAMLDRLTRSLALSGRLEESRAVTHELLALLPRSSQQRAHVVCFCAMVDRLLGRFAEANAILLAELDTLTDEDGATATIIKLGLAFGYMLRGDHSAERDWTREATQTAAGLGDRSLYGSALTVRGLAIMMGGRAAGAPVGSVDEAMRCLTDAAEIIDSLTDQEFIEHIDAFAVLGSAELLIERYTEAERHLERVLAVTRATGKVHLLTNVTLGLGVLHARTGRLAEAIGNLDDTLEWALLTGSDEQRTMAQSYRCWVLGLLGDLPAATEAGEEAVASAGSVPDYFAAIASFRLAQVRFHAGDLDSCRELLTTSCGGPELLMLDATSRLRALVLLASVDGARGGTAEALRWAELAEAAAAQTPVPSNTGLGALARAHALLHTVDAEAALLAADRAAEQFQLARDPIMLGNAHHAAALALAGAQRVAKARERFAQARERFEACGAMLLLEQTVRAERRMNARLPRRKTARASGHAHAASLTRRELDVAELVSAGLTNRQIAERLHLSTRTVESHLARVFMKLDVTTRAQLARTLDRHRPAGDDPD
jgi:DNA-binding CsgD family transcriptional regulator